MPSVTDTAIIKVAPTLAGVKNYILSVIDSNGCHASDTMIITVKDTIIPVISCDDNICIDTSEANTILSITQTTPAAGYTYFWTVGVDGTIQEGQGTGAITSLWTSLGDKVISVEMEKEGCRSTQQKIIHVRPKPMASITALEEPVCPNVGSVDIVGNTTETTAEYTYTWGGTLSFSGVNPKTSNAIKDTATAIIPTTPCNTSYNVTLNVVDKYGCKSTAITQVL